MIALLVPIGMLSPPLILLLHIFGFIVTWALIYICFAIAPIISNCPEKVFTPAVVTNKIVFEPHFIY